MTDVYQCNGCNPACFLVADDDDIPTRCPFVKEDKEVAKWRQIQ